MTMGQATDETPLSLNDLLRNYLALAMRGVRYWKRGIAVFLVVMLGGMVWVVKKPRVFKSEAKFQVQDTDGPQDRSDEETMRSVEARVNQVWNSRRYILQIVRDLHLYDHLQGRTSDSKIADLFLGAVDRRVERDVVSVGFTYKDPERARVVVETLIRYFVDARRMAAEEGARQQLDTVNAQVSQLEAQLAERQDAFDRFVMANQAFVEQVRSRRQGGITVNTGAAPTPAAPRPADNSSPNTRRLRARVAFLSAQLDALRNPHVTPQPTADESPEVVAMRERVRAKQAEVQGLRARGQTLEHPQLSAALRELQELQTQLNTMVRRTLGQQQGQQDLTAAERQRRVEELQRETQAANVELRESVFRDEHPPGGGPGANAPGTNPAAPQQRVPQRNPLTLNNVVEVEAQFDRLNNDVQTTRLGYSELLRRKIDRQSDLRRAQLSGGERIQVIDPPGRPIEPEPPGRVKLSFIVLVVAGLIALGVALVSGFIDTRIYDEADLQRWGELPTLTFVPELYIDLPDGPSPRELPVSGVPP